MLLCVILLCDLPFVSISVRCFWLYMYVYFGHVLSTLLCFNFVQQLTVLNQFAVLTFDYLTINVALRVGLLNKHVHVVHVVMVNGNGKCRFI